MDKCCVAFPSKAKYQGRQGLHYETGLTRTTAGTENLCLHVVHIPPSGKAKPHYHSGIETAVYTISGSVDMLWGKQLENRLHAGPGDYVYIPADMPHLVMNASDSEECVAVVAHSACEDQEGIVFICD